MQIRLKNDRALSRIGTKRSLNGFCARVGMIKTIREENEFFRQPTVHVSPFAPAAQSFPDDPEPRQTLFQTHAAAIRVKFETARRGTHCESCYLRW